MPVTVQSADGNATPVIYEPPQVIAGQPPLRTTCTPASGTIFPLGASTVTCSTTDAVARTDACTFTVTVAAPPKLSATTFMAFGNSITEGKNAFSMAVSDNYPANLRAMLVARYTTQTITVLNKGFGGERTPEGSDRLEIELDAAHPDVLLLEEGVNDILGGDPSMVAQVIDGLRDMVRKAKARGVRVFLATLIPARAGGTPPRGDGPLLLIPETNSHIRLLAQNEGVTLVDLYEGFGGIPGPYIDVDGLHPTELGYRKIAEIFFNAIRATLELPPSPASFGLVSNMPSGTFPFAGAR